jgi:hypothetical protein
MKKGTYISDQLEDQKWSQKMGQAQVLEAGERDRKTKVGIKRKISKKMK